MRKKLLRHTAPVARASCEAVRLTVVVIARSAATKQSIPSLRHDGLLRFARNDNVETSAATNRLGARSGHLWFWMGSHGDYDKLIG